MTAIEEKILANMKIPRVLDMNATCSVRNRISEILLKLEITDLNIYHSEEMWIWRTSSIKS